MSAPVNHDYERINFEWCAVRASMFRAIFREVAREDGTFTTDDYKNHPELLKLHSAFRDRHPSGMPIVGRWAKHRPQQSGVDWLWPHGNNSGWRLRP
jgi:hypothetical protein